MEYARPGITAPPGFRAAERGPRCFGGQIGNYTNGFPTNGISHQPTEGICPGPRLLISGFTASLGCSFVKRLGSIRVPQVL